ncbi:hypothetical protein CH371_19775 [Leptospira wolffii]|uniref:Uncharacterized protein n=1 Tax=Leptospira wolffii TaxID=409998 RepID=A0A2M9Z6Q5_9LEPT|nr:hypothetical protein [Leptospira wolffii]PJZ64106.1 hypothetical protein CH371_19775 [Leptospira wolffii]
MLAHSQNVDNPWSLGVIVQNYSLTKINNQVSVILITKLVYLLNMDEALFERYKRKSPPFDGEVIHTINQIPFDALCICLQLILNNLSLLGNIRMLADWHEHDGYVSISDKIDKTNLLTLISSNQSIYESRDGDDLVRRGIYTDEFRFYLRYYITTNEENEQVCGDFDLSMDNNSIDKMIELLKAIDIPIRRSNALEYFDQRYAG